MKRLNLVHLVCVVALVVAPVVAHGASSGSSTNKASAPAKSAAKRAATPVKKSASKKSATAAKAPAGTAGPRRLEDIHIEGEVPVPQVLFITARDQRRFLESHHDLYLRTSRELGESTPLPARVVLTPAARPATTPAPAPARTEDAR